MSVTSLSAAVSALFSSAIATAYPDLAGSDPVVRPSEHADLQVNAALALAKRAGKAPREVAAALMSEVADSGAALIGSLEISGPGFLNLTLTDSALWQQVRARANHPRLGIGTPRAGERTVIDYSGPNIAKEMHVGHLRGTILGDSLARTLTFLGAEVIPQNHLGDWGTQFGMLIQFLEENPGLPWRQQGTGTVSALNGLYQRARASFDADPAFAERARQRVVELQAGDPATMATWREIVAESQQAFDLLYQRLGVLLTSADSGGESSYNPFLAEVTQELLDKGVAVVSDGAVVVFSQTAKGPDGEPAALIVRKSDGGYGYGTTDLATLRFRINDLRAQRILYVVGAPQALHFRLVFEAAERAGWLSAAVDAEHVQFGSVLGPDGKPFKTRSGETARLADLLDEAVTAAEAAVREGAEERGEVVAPAQITRIAEQAGIGAVKYADLSTSRTKDYLFDPVRMVAFTGNTGVYLQYARTRMVALLRKAQGSEPVSGTAAPLSPVPVPTQVQTALEPAERELIQALDGLGEVLEVVGGDLEPHQLCTYSYELARKVSELYEACPVLSAPEPLRQRRLALVALAQQSLDLCLQLLGIPAPDRM